MMILRFRMERKQSVPEGILLIGRLTGLTHLLGLVLMFVFLAAFGKNYCSSHSFSSRQYSPNCLSMYPGGAPPEE